MLPEKIEQLIRKSNKPLKFVLLRLPNDLSLSDDLEGVKIDLEDLKISSNDTISAIPDLHTNPERASACPLLPDETGGLKCGPAFSAHIQIIKGIQKVRKTASASDDLESKSAIKIKKELKNGSAKKRKSEI